MTYTLPATSRQTTAASSQPGCDKELPILMARLEQELNGVSSALADLSEKLTPIRRPVPVREESLDREYSQAIRSPLGSQVEQCISRAAAIAAMAANLMDELAL